jgi:hypothetical protein
MPTLHYKSQFSVAISNSPLTSGTDTQSYSITVDGSSSRANITIDGGGSAVLFDAAEGPLTDFDFFWIKATEAIIVKPDVGGGSGGPLGVGINVAAGVPFSLSSGSIYVESQSGSVAIETITIENTSDSACDVEFVIVT